MKRISGKIGKLIKGYLSTPLVLRGGIAVFTISGALDLLYHAVSAFHPGALDASLGVDGYDVHLALFIGMVLIVLGVITTRPRASSEPPDPAKIHPLSKYSGSSTKGG